MKQILMGGLIVGGAYFLLKDNIAQFLKPATIPGTPVTPVTPATTTAPGIAPAAAILATLRSHITAGGNGATLTSAQIPDVWNYYLMQTFPSYAAPAPEDIFAGKANAREPVTIDQWYAAIAPHFPAAGLSGAHRGGGAQVAIRHRAGRQAWS